MSLKEFEILQELGKGAFGTVYKVKRNIDGIIYALKKVHISRLNVKEKENALNEIRILASIEHPNVISYKDAFYDEDQNVICMVMEYADDGDLEEKVNNNIKYKLHFTETEIWSIFRQMVNGLKALHDKKIMHRDLKCANIFLTKKKEVKIGDMNVSKIIKMGVLNTQTGTPYYASPEVWKEKPYDFKSDIWSLGCILYEMCTLRPPFRGATLEQLYQKVIKGVYDTIPVIYSKELRNMIAKLLQISPINRPTIDNIINILDMQMKGNENLNLKNDEKINGSNLLKTIRIPRKLKEINCMMPKSKYDGHDVEKAGIKRFASLQKPASAINNKNKNHSLSTNENGSPDNLNLIYHNINTSAASSPKNNRKKVAPLSKEERLALLKNLNEKKYNNSTSNDEKSPSNKNLINIPSDSNEKGNISKINKSHLKNYSNSNSKSPPDIENKIPNMKKVNTPSKNSINIIESYNKNSPAQTVNNTSLEISNFEHNKLRENEIKIQLLKEKYNINLLNSRVINNNYDVSSLSPKNSIMIKDENSPARNISSINSSSTSGSNKVVPSKLNSAKRLKISKNKIKNYLDTNDDISSQLPTIGPKNKIPRAIKSNVIKYENGMQIAKNDADKEIIQNMSTNVNTSLDCNYNGLRNNLGNINNSIHVKRQIVSKNVGSDSTNYNSNNSKHNEINNRIENYYRNHPTHGPKIANLKYNGDKNILHNVYKFNNL